MLIGGKSKYPGSSIYLRINKETAIQGDALGWTDPVRAEQIIAKLLKGKIAITRYIEWPSGIPRDRTTHLDGLTKTIATLQRLVRE